jgi:hypothetical protein
MGFGWLYVKSDARITVDVHFLDTKVPGRVREYDIHFLDTVFPGRVRE